MRDRLIMAGLTIAACCVLAVALVWADEEEAYTTAQTYNYSYSGTPTKLKLAPDSNIDLKDRGRGMWTFDVQAYDASNVVVKIALNNGPERATVEIEATLNEMKQAFAAAATDVGVTATGAEISRIIEKACIKVAKVKLTP